MDNQAVSPPSRTKPEFFYGYIIVIVAFIVMSISYGVYTAYGVFFIPILEEFDWTRAMTSGAFSLSMIVYGVMGFVAGVLNDRLGPRLIVSVCGIIIGCGLLLLSQITTPWQLYLFFGVMVGIGMSGVWVPQLSTVARWFVRRRTLMTGVVIAGVGLGGLVGPPLISRLIEAYNWRLSYIILGGIVLIVMILGAQFLRRDPIQKGQLPLGGNSGKELQLELVNKSLSIKEALHTAQFWLTFIILFCYGFCMVSIMVHIVPHAIDLKISAVSAANILASVHGISVLGGYGLGSVGDRIGNRWVFIISFILMVATFAWIVPAKQAWMLYLFAIVFGFAHGGMSAANSPLVAGLFGLRSHGLIFGVIHIGFTIGAAVGPFVTGYIFDITGSYQTAFLVCMVVSAIGIVTAAVLRPTKKLGGRI
jgi:MFS family permease